MKEKEGRVLSKLKRMTTANETKEDRCVLSWKNRTDFQLKNKNKIVWRSKRRKCRKKRKYPIGSTVR